MGRRISIEAMADTVMEYLNDYADVSAEGMKKAVRKAGNTVKKEISANAPKGTGAYAKSWSVKNTKETANALEVTVYSRNKYQLAHLLVHGHAKRNGGRVAGKSHIAPAEQTGIRQLEAEIERSLRNG